jgi:FKBP-type peptidyl-prolyl cis-trans isomerase (trigger factor)
MIQEALTAELENLKKRAENQVRASLLLEAVGAKEGIKVSTADVDAEMKKMAESMRMEESAVRDYYEKEPRRREDLEFRLTEEKAILFVMENAKVK